MPNRQILVMVMARAREQCAGVQGAPLPYCAPEEVCSPAQRTPGPVLHICTSHSHTTRRLPQVSQPVQLKCSLLCAGLWWPCSVWRGVVTFKHVNNAAVKPSRRWRGGGGTHHSSAGLPAAPGPCTTPPYPATSPHSATLFVRLRWSRRGAARSRSPGLLNKTSFIIIQSEGEYINYLIGVRICAGGRLARPGDGSLTAECWGEQRPPAAGPPPPPRRPRCCCQLLRNSARKCGAATF